MFRAMWARLDQCCCAGFGNTWACFDQIRSGFVQFVKVCLCCQLRPLTALGPMFVRSSSSPELAKSTCTRSAGLSVVVVATFRARFLLWFWHALVAIPSAGVVVRIVNLTGACALNSCGRCNPDGPRRSQRLDWIMLLALFCDGRVITHEVGEHWRRALMPNHGDHSGSASCRGSVSFLSFPIPAFGAGRTLWGQAPPGVT